MATQSVRIPGIADLMPCPIQASARPAAELDRIELAAFNVRSPMHGGIKAIGTLLWRAAASRDGDPIPNETLFELGAFLEQLAEIQEHLHALELAACQAKRRTPDGEAARDRGDDVVAIPEWTPPSARSAQRGEH